MTNSVIRCCFLKDVLHSLSKWECKSAPYTALCLVNMQVDAVDLHEWRVLCSFYQTYLFCGLCYEAKFHKVKNYNTLESLVEIKPTNGCTGRGDCSFHSWPQCQLYWVSFLSLYYLYYASLNIHNKTWIFTAWHT